MALEDIAHIVVLMLENRSFVSSNHDVSSAVALIESRQGNLFKSL